MLNVRDLNRVDMIQNELGFVPNMHQRRAIERLFNSEPNEFVCIQMPRRSGKTALAQALMKLVRDAVTVIDMYDMARNYEGQLHDRMYTRPQNILGIRSSLVIFDEIEDMGYMEEIRRSMPDTRFLNMYTPRNEWRLDTVYHEAITPWEQEFTGDYSELRNLERERDELRRYQEEARGAVSEAHRELYDMLSDTVLAPFMDKMKKNIKKEWDDDENSE